LIVTKVLFSQKPSSNSLKRKDIVSQSGAKTAGVKERLKKEPEVTNRHYHNGS
jgi:hypothetical protein